MIIMMMMIVMKQLLMRVSLILTGWAFHHHQLHHALPLSVLRHPAYLDVVEEHDRLGLALRLGGPQPHTA
jgi:hypothetical protein